MLKCKGLEMRFGAPLVVALAVAVTITACGSKGGISKPEGPLLGTWIGALYENDHFGGITVTLPGGWSPRPDKTQPYFYHAETGNPTPAPSGPEQLGEFEDVSVGNAFLMYANINGYTQHFTLGIEVHKKRKNDPLDELADLIANQNAQRLQSRGALVAGVSRSDVLEVSDRNCEVREVYSRGPAGPTYFRSYYFDVGTHILESQVSYTLEQGRYDADELLQLVLRLGPVSVTTG